MDSDAGQYPRLNLMLEPRRYVRRALEQAVDFLTEVVELLLAERKALFCTKGSVHV